MREQAVILLVFLLFNKLKYEIWLILQLKIDIKSKSNFKCIIETVKANQFKSFEYSLKIPNADITNLEKLDYCNYSAISIYFIYLN